MEFWREMWSEMSRFRRVLLAVMVLMVLGFGIATPIVAAREGYAYGGTLLRAEREGDTRRYTGRVDGREVELVIQGDGMVTFRSGENQYGPYQVEEAPDTVPGDFWGRGIQIRQGERVLFRGGYMENSELPLFDETGEPIWEVRMTAGSSGGDTYYIDGEEVSQEEWNAPSMSQIARWALEPEELTHRGSWGMWFSATLIALLNILQLCFPGFFFRLSLWGHVRDPERAEPSEFYIAAEYAEWIVLAMVSGVLYWLGLTTIG